MDLESVAACETMPELLEKSTKFFEGMGDVVMVSNVDGEPTGIAYRFSNPNDNRHTITITIEENGTRFVQNTPSLGLLDEVWIPAEAASHEFNMNIAACILACVRGDYQGLVIPDDVTYTVDEDDGGGDW